MRLLALTVLAASALPAQQPLRLGIAGLVHGHVSGFLNNAKNRPDVQIVGVADPDPALRKKYAERYNLPADIFFASTAEMLDHAKPEALAIFTSTYDHPEAVEAAAIHRVPAMMEKPLAVNMDHARRIQRAAQQSGIPVIVNYETTWYRSHAELRRLLADTASVGEIRRMVAMDGHQGPFEIKTQPEFFNWLTDPERNGAGALFDFGCYGANLMTWMLGNQRPVAVTAIAQTEKPAIYKRVDDEATILVQYPKAQGVIQASWNWPFNRKDFEVYTANAQAIATGGNNLRVRLPNEKEESVRITLPDLPNDEKDSISYLTAIARGRLKPSGLSSLENNVIVTEILSAARDSVRTGKTIQLSH